MSEETNVLHTEGPSGGESHAAGGVDKARDAARAANGDEPVATPVDAGNTPAPTEAPADAATTAPTEPTAEEKAEIDDMVDFVVTEESLVELNANLPEGATPLVAGGTVKLAKGHHLLTTQA